MRNYSFHVPQERVEPRYYKSTQDISNLNAGRFVRNAVLDGMTYGENDLVPAFLKTCDAIHPLVGTQSIDETTQSCYGALLDSANTSTTIGAIRSVVQPWNTSTVWAPGGNGANSWLAVKLPEVTYIERYIIASTSTTCPISWKLQASNDGSTWSDIDIIESSGAWSTSREEKTFTIPENTRGSYLWYRLYITTSNASTMSISNFRLLRAQSVCDRGQLRLDASVASPLLLSFMDGFASDGVTPVDYTESLSSAIVQALGDYDSEGLPISGQGAVPVDIFSKRDSAGNVTINIEATSSTETKYLAGGMKAQTDRGFSAVSGRYDAWGEESTNTELGSGTYAIERTNGEPFFCTKVRGSTYYNDGGIYVKETTGNWALISRPTSSSYVTFYLRRNILGLKMTSSYIACPTAFYGSRSTYRYRVSSGKLYQKATLDTVWSPVQKIKIASAVWNGTDLYQLQPRTSMLMQWMTQGDNVTYLDA